MFTLFQDISFARRQLTKHRAYALTATLSMALGIGATAAVYSVLYGVLIDPYPYRKADSMLVHVPTRSSSAPGICNSV